MPSISPGGTCYIQNPDVITRCMDDSVFLVNPFSDTIFHLNQLGAGLWQLLSEPTSIEAAAGTVQEAFPDIAGDKIYKDVVEVFAKLRDAQLLLEV